MGFPVCAYQSGMHPSALRVGLQRGHLPTHYVTARPQQTWAQDFHGSSWNLKPGPDPGAEWEDAVTQKSVTFSKWKIPFYWRADATKIQNKAFVSENLEAELIWEDSSKSHRCRTDKYFTV